MPPQAPSNRILLKLSGEALSAPGGAGLDEQAVGTLAEEVGRIAREQQVQTAIVLGGGNFLRARDLGGAAGVRRVTADYMGMLGTVINALALRDALLARGAEAVAMSALPMPTVCEPFNADAADAHLRAGRIVLFAGGTGCPFFTTDTTAALRACEIRAGLLVKGTKVDGVYDDDPNANPHARRYDRLTYREAIERRLGIMDPAAFSLCWDNRVPIVVCRVTDPGTLARAVRGEPVGTLVSDT